MKIRIYVPNFHAMILPMIDRASYLQQLSTAVRRSPVTALLGPRQCGKTTLARTFGQGRKATYFDLESQPDRQRLQNPELMLGSLEGLVILDEMQVMPALFNVLRVLVDRLANPTRFLILGSASPDLVRNVSETLAGRVEFIELSGFDLRETGPETWEQLWLRGGFPRSFLADSDEDSLAWREGFIRTFLERDIPNSASPFLPLPCAASGPCWPIITAKPGMLQPWLALWGCRIRPCVPISIFSPAPSWCDSCNRGMKTSASAR